MGVVKTMEINIYRIFVFAVEVYWACMQQSLPVITLNIDTTAAVRGHSEGSDGSPAPALDGKCWDSVYSLVFSKYFCKSNMLILTQPV